MSKVWKTKAPEMQPQSPEGFEPHLNHNDKPSVVRSHAFFGAREL